MPRRPLRLRRLVLRSRRLMLRLRRLLLPLRRRLLRLLRLLLRSGRSRWVRRHRRRRGRLRRGRPRLVGRLRSYMPARLGGEVEPLLARVLMTSAVRRRAAWGHCHVSSSDSRTCGPRFSFRFSPAPVPSAGTASPRTLRREGATRTACLLVENQLSRLPCSSARRSGVSTVPARSTRSAIS
jgi:hypothetical protein